MFKVVFDRQGDKIVDRVIEKALEESIEHWKRIVSGEEHTTRANCSLCSLFFENNCAGCPIKEKTGETQCNNTPYREFTHHVTLTHKNFIPPPLFSYRVYCPECKRLAEKELKFLKSLRVKTYKRGDKFKYKLERNYILAQVGINKVCLIDIEDGNRFLEPVEVCNSYKITEEEMRRIAGKSFFTNWTKIDG